MTHDLATSRTRAGFSAASLAASKNEDEEVGSIIIGPFRRD